jgi:hypothetical protein
LAAVLLRRLSLTILVIASAIRPSWLEEPHRKQEEAAPAAWGWPSSPTDAQVQERLLASNYEHAASLGQQGTERLAQSPPLVAEPVD